MLLEEAIEFFLKKRRGVLSEATRKKYYRDLTLMARTVGSRRQIESISSAEMLEWYNGLYEQNGRWVTNTVVKTQPGGLSLYTIDTYYRSARAFWNWLVKYGKVPKSPMDEIEHRKPAPSPPKWVEWNVIERLLAAARGSVRDYAFLRVMLATGLRRGGAWGMTLSDINLNECSIRVFEKDKEVRFVYFDEGTAEALEAYLRVRRSFTQYVWVTYDGDHLTRSGLRSLLRRICRAAGVDEIGLHQLRHTFAHESVWSWKIDPALVQRQLGHADLPTTYNLYVKWDNPEQQEAFSIDRFRSEQGPAKLRLVK